MLQIMMIMLISYGMIRIIEHLVKFSYTKYIEQICYKKKSVDRKLDEKYNGELNMDDHGEKGYGIEQICYPLYLTEYGEKIHMSRDCYGLRKRTSRLKKYEICVLCKRSRNERSERKLRSRR